MPATGEGISVSTLSVEISRSGSSTATSSPTCLSQRVTVPSVTLSPSSGSTTSLASPEAAGAGSDSGCAGAGSAAAGSSAAGAAGAAGSSAAGAASPAGALEPSPILASTAPTSTVSSSATRISSMTPLTGEGISVSTLSVEISSRPSSAWIVSPTFLSQRVTVPSVTLSPSAGRTTDVLMTVSPSESPMSF